MVIYKIDVMRGAGGVQKSYKDGPYFRSLNYTLIKAYQLA